jgi:hypothetical protein
VGQRQKPVLCFATSIAWPMPEALSALTQFATVVASRLLGLKSDGVSCDRLPCSDPSKVAMPKWMNAVSSVRW